jgi:hypothetical protein
MPPLKGVWHGRQRQAVARAGEWKGNGSNDGVVVDSFWVLTARHEMMSLSDSDFLEIPTRISGGFCNGPPQFRPPAGVGTHGAAGGASGSRALACVGLSAVFLSPASFVYLDPAQTFRLTNVIRSNTL